MDDNCRPEEIGLETCKALQKNGFEARYLATAAEAAEQLECMIPPDATVGFGGSRTLQQLGIRKKLEARCNNLVYDHSKPDLTREEALEIRRKELTCDIFLTGTNAITRDGRLVNTDGTGNRVAAMIFGPKKTIIVAGINKIVNDPEAAEERIRQIGGPMNSRRLKLPNPCVESGRCMDCQEPTRICNATTILKKCPTFSEIHVLLIGETLGF